MAKNVSKLYQSDTFNNQFGSTDNFNQSRTMNSVRLNMGASSSVLPSKRFSQKFEWKQLMKLNPNYIQSSGDTSSLEPFIGNLLSSSIDEEELQMLPEGYIITLIKLLQLVGESLINIQQRLENENKSLEDKTMQMSQLLPRKGTYQELNKAIKKLKRENKEKDLLIQTFQRMIQNDKGDRGLIDDNNSQMDEEGKQRFFCQFCSGKKFSSEAYLEDHMRRRHLIKSEVIPTKGKEANLDSKLNEMKSHFDTLIRNTQMQNDYQRLNDKLHTIENVIVGNNSDMMNTFNMNLNEMRMNQSKVSNQMNASQRPSVIQPLSKTFVVNPNNDSSSNMLRETMNKINDKIERSNKENNDKFRNLFDEMKKMRMSVSNDISDIKQSQSYNRANIRLNTSPAKAKFDNVQSQNVTLSKPKDLSSFSNNDNNSQLQQHKEKSPPKVYVNTSDNSSTPQPPNQDSSNIAKISVPSVQQNASDLSIIAQKKDILKQNPVKQLNFKEKSTIEAELDLFYKKFNERDNEFPHGTFKTYTTPLTPPDFAKNRNINKLIDSHIQNRLNVMGNNQRISLNNLSKDDLMQLINNCCQDLSEKGMEVDAHNNPSFYVYYKENIDSLLQLEHTVEIGNSIFIESKEDEKRMIENKRLQTSLLSQKRSNVNHGIRLDQEKEHENSSQDSPRFNQSSQIDRSHYEKKRIPTNEALENEFDRYY